MLREQCTESGPGGSQVSSDPAPIICWHYLKEENSVAKELNSLARQKQSKIASPRNHKKTLVYMTQIQWISFYYQPDSQAIKGPCRLTGNKRTLPRPDRSLNKDSWTGNGFLDWQWFPLQGRVLSGQSVNIT